MSQTNKLTVDNVAFLEEGLRYVDAWTPTTINSGGCGVFAYIFHKELEKLNIEHKILALYFDEDDTDPESNLKEYMQNHSEKNLKKSGAAHVCIQIGDLFFDSTGIINNDVLRMRDTVEISAEVLDAMNKEGKWNPTFDKDCTQFIQDKMDEIFSKIGAFKHGMFKLPGKHDVKYTQHTMVYRRKSMNPFAALLS